LAVFIGMAASYQHSAAYTQYTQYTQYACNTLA